VRRFFVIQENLERARWRRRCIKECATAVAQVTGALLNATRLWCNYYHAHRNEGVLSFPFVCLFVCHVVNSVQCFKTFFICTLNASKVILSLLISIAD